MEPDTVLTKPLPEKPAKKDAKEAPQMKAKREAAEKRLKEKREARAEKNQKSKAAVAVEEPVVDESSAKASEPEKLDHSPAAIIEESPAKGDVQQRPSVEQEKDDKAGSADEGEAKEKEKRKKEKAAVEKDDEEEVHKSKRKHKQKGSDDDEEDVSVEKNKKKDGDDVDDDDSSDEDENDWDSKKETNPAKDRFAKVVVGAPHPNREEEHKIIAWWADKVQAVPFWKMPVEEFKKKYRVDVQPWSNNEGWDCEIVRRDTGNPAKIVDAVGKLMYVRLGKYGHCNRLKKYANDKYAQPVGKAKYSFRKQLINRDPYIDALDPDMLEWAKWFTSVGQWVIEQALSAKKEFMKKLKKDVLDIILNAEKKKLKKARKELKQAKKEMKLSQHSMTELEKAATPMNEKQRKAAVVDYIWRKCCRTTVERQENKHADGQPVIPGSENVQYEQKVWDKMPKRRKRMYKGEPQDDIQVEAVENKYQQYVIPTWTAKKGIFSPQPFGTVDLKDGDEVATACNFTIGVGGGVAKWDIAIRIEPVDQIFIAHKEPRKVEATESYSSGGGAAAAGGDDGSAEVAADGPAFQVAEEYVSVVSSTEEIVAKKKGKKGDKGGVGDSKRGKKGDSDADESGDEAKKNRKNKAKKNEQKSDGESDDEEKEKSKKDKKRKRGSDSDDEKEKEKDKKDKTKKKQDSDSEGERQKERDNKEKKKKRDSDSDESEGSRKKKEKNKKQKKQKNSDDDDDAEMNDLVAGLSYQPATSGSKRGRMSREAANTGGKLKGSDGDKSDSDAKKSQKKKKRQS